MKRPRLRETLAFRDGFSGLRLKCLDEDQPLRIVELSTAGLASIGWPAAPPESWQTLMREHPECRVARVVEQHRAGYRVSQDGIDAFKVESPPEWTRPRVSPDIRAGVGDWVLLDGVRIVALLPRYSAMKRAAAGEHYKQQLIAANIDTAFVVCGLDDDFNPRRIERYLMLVRAGGVHPVVVLTKADIGERLDEARVMLDALPDEGVAVIALNALDSSAVGALAPWLGEGSTVVLVGSSGAGKSTLTNTLLGEARMRTGAVRAHDSRGRHTTTHRALMRLPSGACLIDTPGMRELKPTGEEDEAAVTFHDIEALEIQCKFRDCQHLKEPGCAVNAAIAEGRLDPARLHSWRKLHEEVASAALAKTESQKIRGRRPNT